MNDRPTPRQPEPPPAGLCDTCRHARTIANDRGRRFIRCGWSDVDPSYPKYPSLPVTHCRGHERLDAEP